MLSKVITSTGGLTPKELAGEFRELFKIPESYTSNVVYFIMSLLPVPRTHGESNILYIGKSDNTLNKRYHGVAANYALMC